MALHITCNYVGYPKSFLFVVTNLTVEFVGILLLPSKVHADDINDLQYLGAKMATKSEMRVKYGHTVFFERNTSTNTDYQEKLHHT